MKLSRGDRILRLFLFGVLVVSLLKGFGILSGSFWTDISLTDVLVICAIFEILDVKERMAEQRRL